MTPTLIVVTASVPLTAANAETTRVLLMCLI